MCQSDLLQEILVSALGGEYKAAPESVCFKIKLPVFFVGFFFPFALSFMCVFAAILRTSYSLFLRTQGDISLTLQSCLRACM